MATTFCPGRIKNYRLPWQFHTLLTGPLRLNRSLEIKWEKSLMIIIEMNKTYFVWCHLHA